MNLQLRSKIETFGLRTVRNRRTRRLSALLDHGETVCAMAIVILALAAFIRAFTAL